MCAVEETQLLPRRQRPQQQHAQSFWPCADADVGRSREGGSEGHSWSKDALLVAARFREEGVSQERGVLRFSCRKVKGEGRQTCEAREKPGTQCDGAKGAHMRGSRLCFLQHLRPPRAGCAAGARAEEQLRRRRPHLGARGLRHPKETCVSAMNRLCPRRQRASSRQSAATARRVTRRMRW